MERAVHLFAKLDLISTTIGVCIFVVTGCKEIPPNSFVEGVRNASKATLYEGLPHQHFEKQALEKELASKATVQLREFPFYKETLALSEADDRALREIVNAGGTFATLVKAKKCGGFHPDYCVEWRGDDESDYGMLVCFGCHEAELYSPGETVRFDIQGAAYAQLGSILKPYRKNRPARVKTP